MLRVWLCSSTSVMGGVRRVTIGGRRSQGGFRQPLGKHPQVKQGTVEGVPRRIPGTTKVTYTNKKGRTFSFAVPVTEITHPQVTLESASGSWREMDTSFCELGDLEDDMPSPLDECLRGDLADVSLAREIREKFVAFCREYVLMDTTGMKSTIMSTELNVGPDYEHYDRRLRRKRHWLAIRHRFEDVRNIIWPEEAGRGDGGEISEVSAVVLSSHPLTAEEMLEALLWLDAASTFCVRKVHPSDLVDKSEFLPLDLRREVEVVARHARSKPDFFMSAGASVDKFTACAALCINHGVPFSLFFQPRGADEDTSNGSGQCVIANAPPPSTVLGAVRIMTAIAEGSRDDVRERSYLFSDHTGTVVRPDILQGLSRVMSTDVFGGKDALENINEGELCTIVRFCVSVKEQNAAFFARGEEVKESVHGEELSFIARYKHLSQTALSRCRRLLYHADSPRSQIMSEDGYIPFVELQRHTEGTNKAALIHYHLGIRSAQGMRRVSLGAHSSARLAELVSKLEETNTPVSGNTLVVDLVQHMAHKAGASKISLTLKEVNTLLPLLARMQREAPAGEPDTRFNRLFNAVDTTIGAAMQRSCLLEELVDLVEGLAACHMVPVALKQVEMVLVRSVMTQKCSLVHLKRILDALRNLVGPTVSPVLLQCAASRIADGIGEQSCASSSNGNTGELRNTEESERLAGLLITLGECGYEALPGLVARYWEARLVDSVKLGPMLRCGYATLLASAAVALKDHNKNNWVEMASESHRLLVEHSKRDEERDLRQFSLCVNGLAELAQVKKDTNSDDAAVLRTYLSTASLDLKNCGICRVPELTDLLERIHHWCGVLGIAAPAVVAQLEGALTLELDEALHPTNRECLAEPLITAACCLVGLNAASLDLRRSAARVVGLAITHAEEALEALRAHVHGQVQPSRSFELAALALEERENVYKDSILRCCAALQRGGMSSYAEEVWS